MTMNTSLFPHLSIFWEKKASGVNLKLWFHKENYRNTELKQFQEGNSKEVSRTPVSYTHLDVYKRQVLPSKYEEKLFFEKCLCVCLSMCILFSTYCFSLNHSTCLLYTSRCV